MASSSGTSLPDLRYSFTCEVMPGKKNQRTGAVVLLVRGERRETSAQPASHTQTTHCTDTQRMKRGREGKSNLPSYDSPIVLPVSQYIAHRNVHHSKFFHDCFAHGAFATSWSSHHDQLERRDGIFGNQGVGIASFWSERHFEGRALQRSKLPPLFGSKCHTHKTRRQRRKFLSFLSQYSFYT
jgi:hypothetical protein